MIAEPAQTSLRPEADGPAYRAGFAVLLIIATAQGIVFGAVGLLAGLVVGAVLLGVLTGNTLRRARR